MKKVIIIIIIIIAVWAFIRFVIGGSEDTWMCVDGEWVKHGVPSAPKPTKLCVKGDYNPCNIKDYCDKEKDCEYIWFTGACYNPKYVAECRKKLEEQGLRPGEAPPREGVTCTCENNKCITHN